MTWDVTYTTKKNERKPSSLGLERTRSRGPDKISQATGSKRGHRRLPTEEKGEGVRVSGLLGMGPFLNRCYIKSLGASDRMAAGSSATRRRVRRAPGGVGNE